jgi:hypothetical protein
MTRPFHLLNNMTDSTKYERAHYVTRIYPPSSDGRTGPKTNSRDTEDIVSVIRNG